MKDKKNLILLLALILVVVVAIILCVIVGKKNTIDEDGIKFKQEYEELNSSSVVVSIDELNPIKYASFDEVVEILTNGTGIVYFGFPACPWCRNVIPVLFEVAKTNNYSTIYYFNPREIRNDDNEQYQKLIDILNPYLLEKDGNKVLYVPDIYFVKNGQIVGHHLSTVESQTDPYVSLTTDQKQELVNIFQDLFDKIK